MTNPNPPRGGMPTWLKILLVIFLIVFLVCCGGVTTCYFLAKRAATNFINQTGISVDTTGAGLPLPANFPTNVSVPAGFKAKMIVAPPGQPEEGTVNFIGSGTPSTIADNIDTSLTDKGWKRISESDLGGSYHRSYAKDNQQINIGTSRNGADTALDISWSRHEGPIELVDLGAGGGVTAELPASFPSDIPKYAGAKVVSVSPATSATAGSIVLEIDDPPATVFRYFQARFKVNGWTENTGETDAELGTLEFTKQGMTVNLIVLDKKPGTGSKVNINYHK